MSFSFNDSQQLSLFDKLAFLSPRMKKMLDTSWAKAFSDHIFSKIDESIFIPLYSQNSNSRPNAPVNVLVGALMLKEFNGLTDEEITASCCFDYRYQYALHTTSFEEQSVSTRTLSRFRTRLASYKLTTGTDLVHECFVKMADDIREYMDISPSIKRTDSMMIESNIRRMGRLELLYTCLSNLVKELHNDGREELLKSLEHYKDPNDRNKVVYHDAGTPQSERLQKVIDDAVELLPKCAEDYSDTTDYQLLERAINEQTKDDGNGRAIPKQKGDGMDSSSLQNPADPDEAHKTDPLTATIGRIRNGIETVPSILRRKYRVNRMPVRGKSKTEICFGFKMLALNFTKLWLHDRHLQRSRAFEPVNG